SSDVCSSDLKVGDMKLAVTHPETVTDQLNEESLSVLFTYGDVKFMFTGDADQAAESAMLNRHPSLKADILQLGHHGSSTSTSNQFLNQLDPKVAIYSAGKDNSYGHPNEDVIQRVKNHDITLYGTDVNGTIVVSSDGVSYTIKTNKEGTVSPKRDRKSTRLNSSHVSISYAVFCLKKKKHTSHPHHTDTQ